jgi:hypothetical protein
VGPNTIWVSGNNNTALRNDPPNPDWTTVTIDAGQIAAIEQVAGVAVFAGSRQQIGIVGGTGPGVFQLGPEALDFTAMAGPPPLVVVGQRGLAYSQNAQGTFVRLDNPDAGDFRGVRKVAFGIFVITAHSLFGLGTDGGWGAIVTDPDEVLQDLEFISLDGGFEFFLPTQSAAVLSVTGAGATQLDSGVPGGHQAALMRGSELFLVGPNGAITVKPLGGPFSSLRSGTHFNLRALATDADGGLWVVGEQGTTLFRP